MTDFQFEWESAKNASNQRKHDVSFRDAMLVFRDPFHMSEMERVEGGEYRWQTIGRVKEATFLVVVHTYRDSQHHMIIRIISARVAKKADRRRYDDQDG